MERLTEHAGGEEEAMNKYTKRSDFYYLSDPPNPIVALHYCIPELNYCVAPRGIRCRCGAQLHGHDPGDEA